MARYQQMLSLEDHHMSVHYYQFSMHLTLFHNKKLGVPKELQFYKEKKNQSEVQL